MSDTPKKGFVDEDTIPTVEERIPTVEADMNTVTEIAPGRVTTDKDIIVPIPEPIDDDEPTIKNRTPQFYLGWLSDIAANVWHKAACHSPSPDCGCVFELTTLIVAGGEPKEPAWYKVVDNRKETLLGVPIVS